MTTQTPSDVFTPALLSITQVVTLKLSDSNYLSWKLQFEQFLNSQLLLGFVTGATSCPPPTLTVQQEDQITVTNNPAYLKWAHTDQLIKAWLIGSLSEDALKSIYGLQSSQEIWFALAKKYNRISATRRLDIQRRIQTTVKGTSLRSMSLKLKSVSIKLSTQTEEDIQDEEEDNAVATEAEDTTQLRAKDFINSLDNKWVVDLPQTMINVHLPNLWQIWPPCLQVLPKVRSVLSSGINETLSRHNEAF